MTARAAATRSLVHTARPVTSRQPDSFASAILLVIVSALAAGFIEAILIATHRAAAVDPFHFVPARIWVWVPLAWVVIAGVVTVPLGIVCRRRTPVVAASALAAILVACRVALFSRKWGLAALVVVFCLLVWLTRRLAVPRIPRAGAIVIALALLGAVAALAVVKRPAPPGRVAPAAGPNVLLIFADTLRYDAVFRPDGTVRPDLPSLRQLAARSTLYDRAYAASSWTVPSHFAAITGRDAHELDLDFDHQTFAKPVITLAERFRRLGYRTAAVLSNPFLHEASGFARGFDSFEHAARALDLCRAAPYTLLAQVWPRFGGTVCGWSASQVTARAMSAMRDDGAPWFVLLNYMDAHEPSYLEPQCREGAPRRHNTILRLQVRAEPLYHAAVRCLDRSLGVLLRHAETSRRETVVLFTSDHGEHFGERGLVGHGNSLYPELLHVPLIVRNATAAPGRIAAPLSLTALPSIAVSQTSVSSGDRPAIATLVRTTTRKREISVIRYPWQLIVREEGDEELLDLRTGTRPADSPLLPQLRSDAAAVRRAWPRLSASDFRSVGYIQ
jgi:hypothetical protein